MQTPRRVPSKLPICSIILVLAFLTKMILCTGDHVQTCRGREKFRRVARHGGKINGGTTGEILLTPQGQLSIIALMSIL